MGQTFEELIGLHLDDIYSAALCFTQDARRAEELLQEASIRAFHEYPGGRGDADFRRTMLEFLVSTYLQRERRQGRDPLAPGGAPEEELLDATGGLEFEPFPEPGTAGHRLLRSWLGRVWNLLDDGDRIVLWLADIERLRHAAVAEIVGVAEREVRERHYRARLRLSRAAGRALDARTAGGAEA